MNLSVRLRNDLNCGICVRQLERFKRNALIGMPEPLIPFFFQPILGLESIDFDNRGNYAICFPSFSN
ncbi:MAG: hypothetical protein DMG36_00865 [Acidobacteria bacterium]|nr:MAG: hypothetical protein DMG36_00865 [Acidobacteriota bacterium]